jgi:stringent starvation protein B
LAELSRRPYLLRAMLDWMCDSGHTPHLIVDATLQGVRVPMAYVKEGRIVLNVSPSAVQSFHMDAEAVSFHARFGGVAQVVYAPINAVLGIYARETGQGMVFQEEDVGAGQAGESSQSPSRSSSPSLQAASSSSASSSSSPPDESAPRETGNSGGKGKGKRPSLKVVK